MNIEVFQEFPIRARVAYAIMCCERYVTAVYPKLDFRRAASVMWQITDGSDYIDSALHRLVDIYPSFICNDKYDNYDYPVLSFAAGGNRTKKSDPDGRKRKMDRDAKKIILMNLGGYCRLCL